MCDDWPLTFDLKRNREFALQSAFPREAAEAIDDDDIFPVGGQAEARDAGVQSAAAIVVLRDLCAVGGEEQHDTVKCFRTEIDGDDVPAAAIEGVLRALGDQRKLTDNGLSGGDIAFLSGSHSAVVGLPLFETRNLLTGLGYRP